MILLLLDEKSFSLLCFEYNLKIVKYWLSPQNLSSISCANSKLITSLLLFPGFHQLKKKNIYIYI